MNLIDKLLDKIGRFLEAPAGLRLRIPVKQLGLRTGKIVPVRVVKRRKINVRFE